MGLEKAVGKQYGLGRIAGKRATVDALRRDPADAALGDSVGEGADARVEQALIERDQSPAALLDEHRGAALDQGEPGAGGAGRFAGRLGPGSGHAKRVGGIGGGEHHRFGPRIGVAQIRSRSTAAGSANWAPPRPSTK